MIVRVVSFKNLVRRFSSALYVTGDKAQSRYVPLKPHIDFEAQIGNKEEVIRSIEARKLKIDFERVEKRWNFFKMMEDHKNVLELTKSEIGNMLSKLKEDPEKNHSDIEKLLLHLKIVKGDLQNVKEYYYGVEENAALGVLSLPNTLHCKTPLDSDVICHEFLSPSPAIDKSHCEIGKLLDVIEFADDTGMFHYLKSDAAVFECALYNYFQKTLSNAGYTQYSNADFTRSIIVEGCGVDYLDKNQVFTLENALDDLSKLHLVGGGSLFSFMAYFTKHLIQTSVLPVQIFAVGRRYDPHFSAPSLFQCNQNSVIRVFVVTEDDTQKMDAHLEAMTQQIITSYEPLNYHFRIVHRCASNLRTEECFRLSIQMYSNYLQQYVEVGNLSAYDNFLSKRLLLCSSVNKEQRFPRIISGELMNVQKILGCILENNFCSNASLLSPVLQSYIK